ncbi:hypothetical protein B0H10DRAFT_131284 [Mycena sp. CBHHK59/15]|nr:hypothetical protein B0H10DRAFT_131284 [Mycena sp. CBHHK59/15]
MVQNLVEEHASGPSKTSKMTRSSVKCSAYVVVRNCSSLRITHTRSQFVPTPHIFRPDCIGCETAAQGAQRGCGLAASAKIKVLAPVFSSPLVRRIQCPYRAAESNRNGSEASQPSAFRAKNCGPGGVGKKEEIIGRHSHPDSKYSSDRRIIIGHSAHQSGISVVEFNNAPVERGRTHLYSVGSRLACHSKSGRPASNLWWSRRIRFHNRVRASS